MSGDLRAEIEWAVASCREVADRLDRALVDLVAPPAPSLPCVDVIDDFPTNARPTNPTSWWQRGLSEIRGITIHHTLAHDPIATARVFLNKGRPSTEYAFWVAASGECLWCTPLEWGLWHDHTGGANINVSVGLAGALHVGRPTDAQLAAAVRLVAWLMQPERGFNDGMGIPLANVKGHCDYIATLCPGWNAAGWRTAFYRTLELELE